MDKDQKKTVQPISSEQYLEQANQGFEHRAYFNALNSANQAIQQDPKNIDAYLFRAKVHVQLGYLNEAIDDCGKAINLDGKNVGAYLQRGAYYSLLSDREKGKAEKLEGQVLKFQEQALLDCNQAAKLKPGDQRVLLDRASILHDLGRYQEAINDYDEVLKSKPSPIL